MSTRVRKPRFSVGDLAILEIPATRQSENFEDLPSYAERNDLTNGQKTRRLLRISKVRRDRANTKWVCRGQLDLIDSSEIEVKVNEEDLIACPYKIGDPVAYEFRRQESDGTLIGTRTMVEMRKGTVVGIGICHGSFIYKIRPASGGSSFLYVCGTDKLRGPVQDFYGNAGM